MVEIQIWGQGKGKEHRGLEKEKGEGVAGINGMICRGAIICPEVNERPSNFTLSNERERFVSL